MSFEVVPYALPFRAPYATAKGTLERRELVLLRVRTEEGVEGLGEAVPLSLRGDVSLAKVRDQIDAAATRLVGLDLAAAERAPLEAAIATVLELARPRRLAPPALAALECALFDLAAKLRDEPLWRALGASVARPVPCNATLTAAPPEAVGAQASDWAAQGFETFKLKLGAGFDEAASVAAVRAAGGADARIRLDANEAWRARDAIDVLRRLEPYGIELCEQPVAGLRAMARVARAVGIPLAGDESIASEADAHRALQRNACRLATAKLSKVGGIGAARAIARVLPSYLSSALDGPVGIAAAAHAAQLWEEDRPAHGLATQRLFAAGVAREECRLEAGTLRLPSGPGLGVTLDEEALAAHRLG